MKKKFWGFQSYWKWYGLAMTLLVTIYSASVHARHLRNNQHNHRKKLTRNISSQPTLGVMSTPDDYLYGSQLERVVPMPNTTEFNLDTATDRHFQNTRCPNRLRYHHRHNNADDSADHNHHHQRKNRRGRDKRHDIDLDSQRVELIKQQILSKLGFESTPNVTTAVNTRKYLLNASSGHQNALMMDEDSTAISRTSNALDSEPDDFYGKTSEIIGFAEPGYTINGQKLLEFSWSQDMAAADLNVNSATLWVRLELKSDAPYTIRRVPSNLNFTFWVFQVITNGLTNTTYLSGEEFEEHSKLSASLPVTLSSLGWKTFDITDTVKEWYSLAEKDRLRLMVECTGCGDYVTPVLFDDPRQLNEWEKPFLVIHPDPTTTRRVRRRAIDCSLAKRDQCCKQQFYIRFRDIGWHTWIIAPNGYYANYCRGDCGGFHRTPDTIINPHSFAMEDYKKIKQYSLFEPCCAPVKFSSISLIYMTPDRNVIKRDLPRMVVDECGCP